MESTRYLHAFFVCLNILLLTFAAETAPAREKNTSRNAVERALPLLQSSAKTWTERTACTSCHHQSLGSVAIAAARDRNFRVDETMARFQIAAVKQHRSKAILRMFEGTGAINGQAGFGYALLGFAAENQPPDELTDAMAHFLMLRQARDGGWVSESHRPPLEDSRETMTALAIRGLTVYAAPSNRAESKSRIQRAQQWLLQSRPEQQEGRVMRLLGLVWSKAPARDIAIAAREIQQLQQPDGGWQQLPTLKSDAYATGQSLVALRLAGVPYDHPAMKRGEAFLLREQLPDGTWRVPTRRKSKGQPYFETGYPHGIDQFISYAGSAWATIALAYAGRRDIPLALTRTATPARASVAPHNFASDMRTNHLFSAVAFGRLADVREALKAGADPNARNLVGATPLHWAVFDVEKTRLLLKYGAVVDAKTASGKTPLTIAALVDGGEKSLPLLLQAGATPNPVLKEEPGPLAAAILARDRGKVDLLLQKGAVSSEGEFPPLVAGVVVNDAETIGRLRSQIKPQDATDLLVDAILMASEPMVKSLLNAGADPNATDEEGRTALHWAATFNVGDSRIVRLLKEYGANQKLKTKNGETARDLAVASANLSVLSDLRSD